MLRRVVSAIQMSRVLCSSVDDEFPVTCSHCGERFARDDTTTVFDGTGQALYRCPNCQRWTQGPPPE